MPFPPLSVGASFPSQRAFFFSGLSGPGESRGQSDSQPSTLGSRQPGAQQTAPSLGQAVQPSNPPHLHLTPAAPAWQIAPLPAWGKPLRVLGFQSLLFRDWKTQACVGYTKAPLLTLGGRKLRPRSGKCLEGLAPSSGLLPAYSGLPSPSRQQESRGICVLRVLAVHPSPDTRNEHLCLALVYKSVQWGQWYGPCRLF